MKNKRIEIRVTQREKEMLFKTADNNKVTLTELILNSALERPVNYNTLKMQQFAALDKLAYEINRIGNNINQLVPILRGLAADRKIEDGEYKALLEEIRKYNEKREVIAEKLLTIMF